jgi:hypothetical protein
LKRDEEEATIREANSTMTTENFGLAEEEE